MIEPHGLSVADIGKLGKVRGARDVLAVDGAAIEVRGRRVNVIGVDPQQFRSWTPLATASDQRLWEAIAGGDFVSAGSARQLLRLHSGTRYQLAGVSRVTLTYGGAATFGIAGVQPGRQQQRFGRARAHPQRGRPDQRARGGDAGPQA